MDYGGDFTDAAMVPEVLNTVYQVGRGMIEKVEKTLDEIAEIDPQDAAADAAAQHGESPDEDGAAAPGAVAGLGHAPGNEMDDPSGENVENAGSSRHAEPLQKPRRMRFEAG